MTFTGQLLGTYANESPEWYAARTGRLGGSDIAAVLGLSKWDSPFSLWHRMAGRVPDKVQNSEMRAGKFLEDGICASFASLHDMLDVERAGTYVHQDRPWQLANPDRLLFDDECSMTEPCAVLETKLALYPDEWGPDGTDEIPPYYLAQCRWYLDVLGLPICYVHVFIGSCGEFRTYVIQSDDADQRYMREKGRAFLDSIERNERPPIDGHDATYQAVRVLHPEIEDVSVEVRAALAIQYTAALRHFSEAESLKSRACAELLDAMGTAKKATYLGDVIATRQAKQGGAPYLKAARGLLKESA